MYTGFDANNSIIYHIYPLGACGAPRTNEGAVPRSRILKVIDWIPHLRKLNVNAVYFGPVFQSEQHGYDTTDYTTIDSRLGTNADFALVCEELHKNNIAVILDGVFNHTGRSFFAFKDIRESGSASEYCSWYQGLGFDYGSPAGDPFHYEAWNGHYNLCKLNLRNPAVCEYIEKVIDGWLNEFDIDGIRFDAAECMDHDFFRRIHAFCRSRKPNMWLMGEMIHGDYNRIANADMLDSATNYECYKGMYSSHNDRNYFEIAHSINRQKGNGGIYSGISLYNFVDNHDVTRVASILSVRENIQNMYTLLYTMPGIPSIYYGSEFGIPGVKGNGTDAPLRPSFNPAELKKTGDLDLYRHIVRLGELYAAFPALRTGSYTALEIRNGQLVYKLSKDDKDFYILLNCESSQSTLRFGTSDAELTDLLTGRPVEISNGCATVVLAKHSSAIVSAVSMKPSAPDISDELEAVGGVNNIIASAGGGNVFVRAGQIYADSRGDRYRIVGVATHSVTLEDYVIRCKATASPNEIMFVEPLEHFTGTDKNGIKRFTICRN